jgi:cytochrome c-type biogenesis protein CcmH
MTTPALYAASAALTLLALAVIVVPMLRHRKASGIGLSLVAIILLFPLAVGGLYISVSSYPWNDQPLAIESSQQMNQPAVKEMITELAARLESEPEVEGYILLARSYTSLQRFPDAVDAWHKAWELTEGKSVDVSLGYAEALILADRRTLKTSAADLLESAIEEVPNDPRALWYGGLSAAALGNSNIAAERYSRLLQTDLPDEFRLVVQQQLAKLGGTAVSGSDGTIPGAAESVSEEGGGIAVTATIKLDPAVAELAPPGATLFVFARDAKRPGPPIAAKRLNASEFPITVILTDADVMLQGNSLSKASQLKIAARISADGNPIAAPGDLYGEAIPVRSEGDAISVSVLINSVED